ncbi:MAG: hypothetical protein ACREOR_01370, partial [Candidatus Binatia bacterium]
ITRQDNFGIGIDTDAYLDSGAEVSLFNGDLLAGLEIDLINNNRKSYGSTFGASVTGYLHTVRLILPDVGDFSLDIGFSNGEIRRNLLGRDFFNLVQIGFRENQLEYYLNPRP